MEPSLKGPRGILEALVLTRRVLEVLVWNWSVLEPLVCSREFSCPPSCSSRLCGASIPFCHGGVAEGCGTGTGSTESPEHRGGSPGQGRALAASLADPCKAMEHIPGLLLLPCLEEVLGSFGVAMGWFVGVVMPSSPVFTIPGVLVFPSCAWHLSLFSLCSRNPPLSL